MNKYVMGIDFGTGGCKLSAVDDRGNLAATVSHPYRICRPKPGWAEQVPEDWLKAAAAAMRELSHKSATVADSIVAISLSAAAHIGVLLDNTNKPVRNAILWSDQRSYREVTELEKEVGDEILRITYQKASTTWTLPHLRWIKNNEPQLWGKTKRVMLSKDYVVYRLTGTAMTDSATAVSSLLVDAANLRWSGSLCRLAAIRLEDMPEIGCPTDMAGALTTKAAETLGLKPGIPVFLGTLDSAAEMYGASVIKPGHCQLRLATAGGIQLLVGKPSPNNRLITYPHPIKPLWFVQAGTNSCASSVKWAMDVFTAGQGMSFSQWDKLAKSAKPGCDGLIFHPYLAGERCPHWDPNLRGSFVGASAYHRSEHFARAVYEGTALAIKDAFSELDAYPRNKDVPIVAVGGGTLSQIWTQIVADVLDCPIVVESHADSSYGAALLGWKGLTKSDIPRSSIGHMVEPIAENVALYKSLFERYRSIHKMISPVYH